MPRAYHSPSSIKLGLDCQHAWALRYVDGLRMPDVKWSPDMRPVVPEWADPKRVDLDALLRKQRSPALGTAMHTVGERHYRRDPKRRPDWESLPGQIFHSGAHLLPHPNECYEKLIEEPIGRVDLPPSRHPDAPKKALRVGGLLWAGYRDLLVHATPEEYERLDIDPPGGWLLTDYKSSANISQWALDSAGLAADVQANLYAIDVCELLGVDRIAARWVYFETKKVRRAKAVDAVIHLADAHRVVEPCIKIAHELDSIIRSADAPKNPAHCGAYGGCPYHVTAGGPCDARRSIGALIQARVKKKVDPTMALSPAVQKKLDEMKAKQAAAGEGEADTADAADATEGEAEETPPPATTPRKGPGRPPGTGGKKPTPAAPKKPATAPVAASSSIVEMATALAEAEANVAALKVALLEALA